jgi:hypothetical protein
MMHVSGTDDHDERGILISDEHTNAAIRRKMHEKRMKKMDGVLARLKAPALEGPSGAEVTLVGWGSTASVIQEAAEQLCAAGLSTNRLHFKYLLPFHGREARTLLEGCRQTIVVENNFSGQFARHLRAETGFRVDHVLTRYDGEPFEPRYIAERVKSFLAGRPVDLRVSEDEAREMAYHYIRIHMQEKTRPGRLAQVSNGPYDEAVWEVELVARKDGHPEATLVIGMDTGSLYGCHALPRAAAAAH